MFRNQVSRPLTQEFLANGWESPRACSEFARSEILSKGCLSQEVRFFLWKAVEKGSVVIPTGAGANAAAQWRNLLFLAIATSGQKKNGPNNRPSQVF